jgi:hypothetical protein
MSKPKDAHGKAIKWIGRYWAGTKDEGIIMKPDRSKGFEVYVDASFVADWDPETADWDSDTAKSRMGYISVFVGCPISWTSRVRVKSHFQRRPANTLQFHMRLERFYLPSNR